MTLSRTGARALAAACALTFLLAACGGDDDSAETKGSSSTEESTTTAPESTSTTADEGSTTTEDGGATTTTEDAGGDEPDADAAALAEAVTLTEDDFEADWTSEPPSDDGAEITDCFTEVDVEAETLAEFDSPSFRQEAEGVLIGVGSTGLVLSDAEVAEAFVDEASTDQVAGCTLDQLLAGFMESDFTVGDSDLSPAPGVPTLGEQTAALNGYFTMTDAEGTVYEGEVSIWFIRTGNVVSGVSVLDIGDTELATVVDQTTGIIADKQAAEVG